MNEIEKLINTIGQDAMVNQMQIFNEDDDLDEEGEENRRKKRQGPVDDERTDDKAEEERRKRLMDGWSDRDKSLLDDAKSASKEKLDALRKELNKNFGGSGDSGNQPAANAGEALAFALYDGGDAKSSFTFEQDSSLSDAEKESLLSNHFQSLSGIDDMMEAERKR